jgi:hypothetical protein
MKQIGRERRTLLQRGLALLGGGAAVAAGVRWGRGAPAEAAAAARQRIFYARIRPVPGSGIDARSETRLVSTGELLDAPDGKRVGQFSTNCFCLGTPFGPHATAPSNLEMQVLQLHDGTLFGMSAPGVEHGLKVHAIVGGTAAYAAARGTYVQRPAAAKKAGPDLVEFVVTLAD